MLSSESNAGWEPGERWPGPVRPPRPDRLRPPAAGPSGLRAGGPAWRRPAAGREPGAPPRPAAGPWPLRPDLAGPAPRARRAAAGLLVVAGAHGGAGTTTLAALLAPARDAGVLRPGRLPVPAALGSGPVVLAARGTAHGSALAISVGGAIVALGARLVAVAVIGDGLPETGDAAYRYRLLDYRVPVIRVPFVPTLRAGEDPCAVALPRRARGALACIRALAGSPAVPPVRA